jgi:hypothetical protein
MSAETEAQIRTMAAKYNVRYEPIYMDWWATNVAQLLGDDVKLDLVEHILMGLSRRGLVTTLEMLHLQAKYLREHS